MCDVTCTHQQRITDEQFLGHLKLPGVAGRQLQQLRRKGIEADARAIVARHYRTRRRPVWSFYSHGSPWHETDAAGSVLTKSRQLLRYRFRNSWAPHQWIDLDTGGDDPDWRKGLAAAPTSIARCTWVTELSTAFALTGDTRFAAKALQLTRSFAEVCPFILDPRFAEDHDTYFGGPGHGTQMVSYRLFRWIDLLHSGVMHLPLCSDDDVYWLVKQIWFYACQFSRLLNDEIRRDNHHLLDHGHAPFVLGLMFPEFTQSPALLKAGAKVIRHHLARNLLKDGAYVEHSTEYQYHVLFHYLHPYGVAKANRVALFSQSQVRALRRWVMFNARCSTPDGMLPAIGDSPGRPLHHLFGTLATPIMDRSLAAMAQGLGCVPGTHAKASAADTTRAMKTWQRNRPVTIGSSAYYSAQRKQPDPTNLPSPATCQYPYGGYTFFRSAWDPQADYMAVSHFSGDYGTHAHWDMMSFILHTRGKTLIGDPASRLYLDRRFHGHGGHFRDERVADDRLHRGYSYSVNAHNCLVINDDTLKPLQAMNHGTFWGGWPPTHGVGLFKAGGPIEIAELWHDAYAPTRHRRFIVHIVGIGFALVDLLSARPGLAPHQYSQYFHFEGNVKLSPFAPQPGDSLRATNGDAACLIVPGAETDSHWRTFPDTYLDDVYGLSAGRTLPWIAALTRRIRGQAVFTHFILTGDSAAQHDARCHYLGSKAARSLEWQSDGVSANALDLGHMGTLLLASSPYGAALHSDVLATDAELAVVHLDSRHRVRCGAMVRGTSVTIAGQNLYSGRRREWFTLEK